ncbi:helix-turn-helix transcriptional regulator [Corynebacterium glyciniphilum]|uniref:helix-turn-helix transcriptional regulator n=1 Tax=Corynebacterium glyciniphilum TaxID=1404244 RepID=UPI003FD67C5D
MTTANTNTGVVPPLNMGTRCMMARNYSDLEIQELADLTGLSRNTIRNYEKGRTIPRRPALILISFATGVDLEWLETGKTPDPDGPVGGSEVRHQGLEPRTR